MSALRTNATAIDFAIACRELAPSFLYLFGSLLGQRVKLIAKAVTLIGELVQLSGKFAVDFGEGGVSGLVCSATFFYRSRTVIIGIVRHCSRTSTAPVGSTGR